MQSVEPLIVLLDEGKEQGETLNIELLVSNNFLSRAGVSVVYLMVTKSMSFMIRRVKFLLLTRTMVK